MTILESLLRIRVSSMRPQRILRGLAGLAAPASLSLCLTRHFLFLREASALNNAADNEKKVVQKSLDGEHQLQLLQMDKSFLQKELELVTQRAERSEKDNLRNEELLREAMIKRDDLLMQLSEARHQSKGFYEEKLEKEILKLREDSARELNEIRCVVLFAVACAACVCVCVCVCVCTCCVSAAETFLVCWPTYRRASPKPPPPPTLTPWSPSLAACNALRCLLYCCRNNNEQVWERENKMLREQQQNVTKQYEEAKHDMDALRHTHENLIISHAKINSDQDAAVLEMRNEVKMKNFEAAKIAANYEELKVSKKEAELVIEHLRQQLVAHQEEFANLRQEAKAEKEILTDKIRGKDEQLEVYLQAEINFEAQIEEGQDPGAIAALSAPKRRVQHAVQLARRCVDIEKARVELLKENEVLLERIEDLEARLEDAQNQIDIVKQPTKYVLDSCVEKDAEIRDLRKVNEELSAEVVGLRVEMKGILERREGLSSAVEIMAEFGGMQQGLGGAASEQEAHSSMMEANAGTAGGQLDNQAVDLSVHLHRNDGSTPSFHSPVGGTN